MRLLCIIAMAAVASLSTAPGVVEAECCPQTCQCWENCFSNPSTALRQSYAELYQMVDTIRRTTSLYGIRATAYLMDSTESNVNKRNYQRNLGSLLVLTQKAGTDCNQFYAAKYFRNSAWLSGSWQNVETCRAAELFQSSPVGTQWQPQQSPNWFGGGCSLTIGRVKTGGTCSGVPSRGGTCSEAMAIALMNNDVQRATNLNWCNWFAVRAAIRVGPPVFNTPVPPAAPFPRPGSFLNLQTSYTPQNLQASSNLVRCISQNCCSGIRVFPGRKKREAHENAGLDELEEVPVIGDRAANSTTDGLVITEAGWNGKEMAVSENQLNEMLQG